MSGQDTKRGTFTQRHAVLIDPTNGAEFTPLDLLTLNPDGTPNGGRFLIYDSPLSEYAAVGFGVRLLGGQPRRSGAVGSPVRRFRQRGAVDHR